MLIYSKILSNEKMASSHSSLLSIKVTSQTIQLPSNASSPSLEKRVFDFFEALEDEVVDLEYGVMNVSVVLKDGVPSIENTTVVKSKKIKYLYEKSSNPQ